MRAALLEPDWVDMKKKLTTPLLIIEGGAKDANMRYLAEFTAPDPILLLINGKTKHLLVSVLEAGRARQTAAVTQVWTPQALGISAQRRASMAAWAAALLRELRIKSVTVAQDFPVGVADHLRQGGVRVSVSENPLVPERRRKSVTEIKHITRSQRAAVRAMRKAMHWLTTAKVDARGYLMQDGRRLTSERVRVAIDRWLLEQDCFAEETIVAGGRQAADPHERGHGPLRAGQPIVLDIFPRHKKTGYWGDITRTVIVGSAPPVVRRMYRAVAAAQQAALKAVKANVSVRTVHRAAQAVLDAHGFETRLEAEQAVGFIHSTGHGIGLEIHEAPSVGLTSTRLQAGDVITIEPGLYYPEWGGIRIEDTVEVTRTGARILARCPLRVRP